MRTIRRISLGGRIFLIHFSCAAIVILAMLLPQPEASIKSGDNWYWQFLDYLELILIWLTAPVSFFDFKPSGYGPVSAFVSYLTILALNSLVIGYSIQLLVWFIRPRLKPPTPTATVVSPDDLQKLLDDHHKTAKP